MSDPAGPLDRVTIVGAGNPMLPDYGVIIIEQLDQILLLAEVPRLHPAGKRRIWLHGSHTSVLGLGHCKGAARTPQLGQLIRRELISDPP
jgi:hypothetical protein